MEYTAEDIEQLSRHLGIPCEVTPTSINLGEYYAFHNTEEGRRKAHEYLLAHQQGHMRIT
jgi:hypothetical protein